MPKDAITPYHIWAAREAISDLWRLRLDPRTADQLLAEEAQLMCALSELQSLVNDVRTANDNGVVHLTAAE